MAWDDPSPRNRVARPAPRDPGDLAANLRPGYGGIGRQGYGNDNATLGQLVGRSIASIVVGGLVFLALQFIVTLAGASLVAARGIAAVGGLFAAALFMRNLSSGASGWRLVDLAGWFVPRERRAWDRRLQGHWFRRRDGFDDDRLTLGEQVAVDVAVDVVEAAIDRLID